METQKRLYQLDFLRLFAVIYVLLFHYTFLGPLRGNTPEINFPILGELFKYGYLGVDLFFIISGFVIVLSAENKTSLSFTKARFFRLYPAYWLCVTLTFLIITWFGKPEFAATFNQFLVNLTMFQRVFDVSNIDGVYWSLFVELRFYFLIAISLILSKFKIFSLNRLVYAWLVLTILNIFFNKTTLFRVLDFVLVFNYSSYFIVGIVLYNIYKTSTKCKHIFLILTCLVISLYNNLNRIALFNNTYKEDFSIITTSIIITIFFIIFYFIAIRKLNFLNFKYWLPFGLLTYPLYLIHENIGFIMFNNTYMYLNKYALLILVTVIMIIVSYMINQYIENPLSRFLKKKL